MGVNGLLAWKVSTCFYYFRSSGGIHGTNFTVDPKELKGAAAGVGEQADKLLDKNPLYDAEKDKERVEGEY